MGSKDRMDIIIGMVCNGCEAMTVNDHLRSWLLFLRLLHAISVAFVCFSEYYLCEFNQRGSLSTYIPFNVYDNKFAVEYMIFPRAFSFCKFPFGLKRLSVYT